MYLSSLHLQNFRNYQHLDLELPKGLLLFLGDNAQGKSNLLEAGYLLAIGRSVRATHERDIISWNPSESEYEGHTQVAGTVYSAQGTIRLQIDYARQDKWANVTVNSEDHQLSHNSQKRVRINGIARRTSDLVGVFNAVLFEASDIQLVEGTPSIRRRYLDILLSQISRTYLRALQQYHKVLTQRNHLLRAIRDGRSKANELEFWDEELVQHGAYILHSRFEAVEALDKLANPIFSRLTNAQEVFSVTYVATAGDLQANETDLRDHFRKSLLLAHRHETMLGSTQIGPHRDDLHISTASRDLRAYGSRGEQRIAALTLRLAEGEFLTNRRGDEPVLLLDDILSELDFDRSQYVMDAISNYSQVLLTSAQGSSLTSNISLQATTFHVHNGTIVAV